MQMDSVITDLDGRGVLVVESNLTGELWLSGNRITGFICVCSSFRDSFGPNFLQLSCSYSEQLGINLVIAAGSSFERGLFSFLIFILGGGIGLFASMGAKNPSSAIFLAAMSSPFLTFYAIVSFHEQYTLGVFLVMGATYAWASTAMLIPAIHKFDVALGRTSMDRSETS